MRMIAAIALLFCVDASAQIPDRVMQEWKTITEGTGTWITDNKAYMSDQETFDHYGVTWQWGIGKTSVTGRLFGLKDGKESGTFWEFRMYYDPADQKLKYMQFGNGGLVGKAEFEFKDDTHTVDVVTFYSPDGSSSTVKHETETKGDTQYSQSYALNGKGEWEKRRYYVWIRQ